jgi:hypothetical protein
LLVPLALSLLSLAAGFLLCLNLLYLGANAVQCQSQKPA